MSEKARIQERVRKLLKLSKSPNQHEAERAAEMAQRLMVEHELSSVSLEEDVPVEKVVKQSVETYSEQTRQMVRWRMTLASYCAKANGCRMYYNGGRYTIMGQPSKVEAVQYIYKVLKREIPKLAEAAWRAEGQYVSSSPRSWKGSFRTACAYAVGGRLVAARASVKAEAKAAKSTALAVVNTAEMAVQAEYDKLRLERPAAWSVSDYSGHASGARAGQSMALPSTGLESGGQRKALGRG